MMYRKFLLRSFLIASIAAMLLPLPAAAQTCQSAIDTLNAQLSPQVDAQELNGIIASLDASANKKLPANFLTKQQAMQKGWRPGMDLWNVRGLKGASIGGDVFGNREGKLPRNKWREADLDYKGGHRGAKRLVFSSDGQRYITVDHYQHFVKIPACQSKTAQ